MILRVRDLRKSFKQAEETVEVLTGIDLEIEKGETLALMGRSGCGKSTLISLLSGLDTPTSGTIEFEEQNLADLSAKQINLFRARNIGIIFQQFHLLFSW